MKRVLIFGMTENPGGIENCFMRYYRRIDRNRVQFDFLCNSYEKIAFEDEIIALGGHTFHIARRSEDYFRFKKELDIFFKEHAKDYSIIWVKVCSLANIDYLKAAKKYGIKTRIIHSHNTKNMDGKLRGLLHYINRLVIDKYATDFWACSIDAGKWFYNDKLMKKLVVINNAVDVESLRFNKGYRANLRKQYGLDNKIVIGNVGRLHFQKNQVFMLKLLAELVKINSNYHLVLIGQGPDEKMLKDLADSLGIKAYVTFTGVQQNVPEWYSAFDLFLLPSVFEGLCNALLEAQANGLSIIASDVSVPEEARIVGNITSLKLEDSKDKWVEAVTDAVMTRTDYNVIKQAFIDHRFDVEKETEYFVTQFEKF